MSGWAALSAVAGAGLSTALEYDLNRKLNRKSQDHSAGLSNMYAREQRQTAYQDTMKDMHLAGLNPILAYRQGPSSIGSVSIQGQNVPNIGAPVASIPNTVNNMVNSAQNRKQSEQQIELIRQQAQREHAQNMRLEADRDLVLEQTKARELENAHSGLDLRVKERFLNSVLNKANIKNRDSFKTLESIRELREILFGGNNPMSLFK